MPSVLARFLKVVRRDGPVEAIAKVARYARWRSADAWMRIRIGSIGSAEERFTYIYRANYWQTGESVSGPGSSLDASANLRGALPALFEDFAIKSVFDAPCGDFNWMKSVVAECGIDYRGADIVRPLIERNIERHGGPSIAFEQMDVSRGTFPAADLWLCRDLFYHLSNEDIRSCLERFIASPIRYMLASTYRDALEPKNPDIESGFFHRTDLLAPPFSLDPKVLMRIEEPDSSDLCLWSREQVAASLARRG